MIIELETLRNQIQVQAGQIEDLMMRIENLTVEVTSLRTAHEELSAEHTAVPQLNVTVVALGERVHAHEQELNDIRRGLERFGGSIMDDMALERRLRNIEDRMSPSGRNGSEREEPASDRFET
ncbi:MAG TPA: hypothetical protein VF221_01830 [Chloroflexota bacterium]